MSISITITLNTVVGTPGPFSLYSDTDSYTTPFVTGVSLASLQGGYGTSLVPDETISIKIKSTGGCSYEIIKSISLIPITPTPTPTKSIQPTPTPTSIPIGGAYPNRISLAYSPYNLDKCQAYICYNNLTG
jgi:hypothetical protein